VPLPHQEGRRSVIAQARNPIENRDFTHPFAMTLDTIIEDGFPLGNRCSANRAGLSDPPCFANSGDEDVRRRKRLRIGCE
jgi:hypothetical protein